MNISLITRDDCVYCDNAKLLLDNNKREYTEQKIGVDISREDVVMLFPEYNVLPIVFVDGDPIGGYTDLMDHIFPALDTFSDDVKPESTYAVKDVLDFGSDKEFRTYFKSLLQDNIVEITFEKADESRRVMTCTLSGNIIPPEEKERIADGINSTIDSNPDLQKVWEIEHAQWRSFRYDRLISYQVKE
jgi:glutaredoxin